MQLLSQNKWHQWENLEFLLLYYTISWIGEKILNINKKILLYDSKNGYKAEKIRKKLKKQISINEKK